MTGLGHDVGAALSGHKDVDVVTFTGSTLVGRRVMAAAAGSRSPHPARVGRQGPFVVFDDADLDAAIQGAVTGSLINRGGLHRRHHAIVARSL